MAKPSKGKNEPVRPIIVKKVTVVAGGHHGGAIDAVAADGDDLRGEVHLDAGHAGHLGDLPLDGCLAVTAGHAWNVEREFAHDLILSWF